MSDKTEKLKKAAEAVGKGGMAAAQKAKDAAIVAGKAGKDTALKTRDAVINAIDQDGDGKIDVTDIIIMAMKVPGVKINRAEFLQKELFKYCNQDVIDKAIETTPAKANIESEIIEKVADEVIKFERNAVSGISAALGMPGGVAMAATIPADIAQYYGYMLRAAQKLMYLYGFPELDVSDNKLMVDSETVNSLTVCLGIMYGVANANIAIKAMAKALAAGVEKQLLNRALTKGVIYPIVKSVAKWFSVKMTKEVFAGFFKKAIPVVGGIVGGGITFVSFKPCCDKLRETLKDTILSNPDHKESEEEEKIFNEIKSAVIDVEPEDIVEVKETEEE